MTNPQKYAKLLEKYQELSNKIDDVAAEKKVIRDQMDAMAVNFPSSFYFRVKEELLYRTGPGYTIQLREFDND